MDIQLGNFNIWYDNLEQGASDLSTCWQFSSVVQVLVSRSMLYMLFWSRWSLAFMQISADCTPVWPWHRSCCWRLCEGIPVMPLLLSGSYSVFLNTAQGLWLDAWHLLARAELLISKWGYVIWGLLYDPPVKVSVAGSYTATWPVGVTNKLWVIGDDGLLTLTGNLWD